MVIDSKFPEVICDNLILYPEEFCYSVYMPLRIGNSGTLLPGNLLWIYPLLLNMEII